MQINNILSSSMTLSELMFPTDTNVTPEQVNALEDCGSRKVKSRRPTVFCHPTT